MDWIGLGVMKDMFGGKNDAFGWLRSRESSESFQLSGCALDVEEWRRIVGDVCAYLETRL